MGGCGFLGGICDHNKHFGKLTNTEGMGGGVHHAEMAPRENTIDILLKIECETP